MIALHHRRILFFLFSASFFVAASSVLFYAYGYRFSIERGIFIYTGSLSLKTNVETVTIRIDGELIPEKKLGILNNSIQVSGLAPGEHFVEVSAPGYQTWSKKFVIQSGLTAEFWNIFLVEANYPRETIAGTENVLKMFPAPNSLMATVKVEGDRTSVDILDITSGGREEVYTTTTARFLPTTETNIEWSPESHKLIVPLVAETGPLFVIATIETKESRLLSELSGITDPIRAPRWDATTKDFLFFLAGQSLYRLDTRTTTPGASLLSDHISAYDISGNKLLYLDSHDGLVYEINGDGNDQSPKQITDTALTLTPNGVYSLISYDDTRLAIIEEEAGSLSVYNEKAPVHLKEIGRGVKSIQYSDDGKKLLSYSENEISVYFNRDWEAQPFRSADSIVQIARFSAPVRNVMWAEDYEHVIFSLGKNVKMIELDNRDRRNLSDLLTLPTAPLQLLPRFGSDTLYVVSESDGSATNTVFRITLPQFATFLGL